LEQAAQGQEDAVKEIVADAALVACCGLYCGACGSYLRGRCPGCRLNERAGWCKVRACCLASGRADCAECPTHADPRECSKYHNLISRVFGFIFRSDRRKCVLRIREVGREAFSRDMAAARRQSMPR
jgi:hypothetical protein